MSYWDWLSLLQHVDYHHGKWYLYDDGWEETSLGAAMAVIGVYVPESEIDRAIKLIRQRDKDARARAKD